MDEVNGTPFGQYRLIKLLGRGGMGEVWRAHDTVTDRIVAIKLLPANLSEDEDFQQRFRREAHAAARLDTPHVVPIYDYGEIDGRLFVSMRLIEGRDLAAVLADGPLDPARAVRIIDQVAKALHAAHEVTQDIEVDDRCPSGGTSRRTGIAHYPLPQPPQNPIMLLTGHGHDQQAAPCTKSIDFDEKRVRTGD
jgi:serine/threonine protein kinase